MHSSEAVRPHFHRFFNYRKHLPSSKAKSSFRLLEGDLYIAVPTDEPPSVSGSCGPNAYRLLQTGSGKSLRRGAVSSLARESFVAAVPCWKYPGQPPSEYSAFRQASGLSARSDRPRVLSKVEKCHEKYVECRVSPVKSNCSSNSAGGPQECTISGTKRPNAEARRPHVEDFLSVVISKNVSGVELSWSP
jgi:hypothetical protein